MSRYPADHFHILRAAATQAVSEAQDREAQLALVTIAVAAQDVSPAATAVPFRMGPTAVTLTGHLLNADGAMIVEDWTLTSQGALAQQSARCLPSPYSDLVKTYSTDEGFDVERILADLLPNTREPIDGMPGVVYSDQASDAWCDFLDAHRWNAVIVDNTGAHIPARLVGSASRDSDGIVGVEFVRRDLDTDEPCADADVEFLSCEDFRTIVIE